MRGPRGNEDISLSQPDKGNMARADGLHARCAGRMALHIKGRASGQASRCFHLRIGASHKRNRPIDTRCPCGERPCGSAGNRQQACGIGCDLHLRITVSRNRELSGPLGRERGRRLRRALQSEINLQFSNETRRAAEIACDDQRTGNRRSPGCRPRLTGADKRQHPLALSRSRGRRCGLGAPTDRGRACRGRRHARFCRARQRDVGRGFYRRGGACPRVPRDLDERL